jgi:hypothetical protein
MGGHEFVMKYLGFDALELIMACPRPNTCRITVRASPLHHFSLVEISIQQKVNLKRPVSTHES